MLDKNHKSRLTSEITKGNNYHMHEEYNDKLQKCIKMAEAGIYDVAIVELNQILEVSKNPIAQSYKAYCEANIYGTFKEGIQTCQEMLKVNYLNPVHYLIMGRILLMNNKRAEAISVFKKGLKLEPYPLIIQEMKGMGIRKEPVFSSLERDHPFNKIGGKILSKFNLR
jgi:tetratricopeptide (TPR) repeat protein